MAMRGADDYAGMNDDVDTNVRCMFDHVCESNHMRMQLVPAAIRVLRPRTMLTYSIASFDARAHTAVHGRPRRVLHRGPREVAPREGAAVRRNDLEWAPLGVPHGDTELVDHEPAAGVVVNLAVCAPHARAPPTNTCQPPHAERSTTHTTPTDQSTHHIACTRTRIMRPRRTRSCRRRSCRLRSHDRAISGGC